MFYDLLDAIESTLTSSSGDVAVRVQRVTASNFPSRTAAPPESFRDLLDAALSTLTSLSRDVVARIQGVNANNFLSSTTVPLRKVHTFPWSPGCSQVDLLFPW